MNETLNKRLLDTISKKRMTQREVALQSGITESALSHYIKGDRTPRAKVLAKIAKTLNTTTDYLLNGVATDSQQEIAYAKELIARNISNMSKEDKLNIISILLEN